MSRKSQSQRAFSDPTDTQQLPKPTIAVLNAEVVGRVYPFAGVNDVRYYLNGLGIFPGAAPLVVGTNGHILYLEEDTGGTVSESFIVRLSKRAAFFLKKGNKVVVSRDSKSGSAMIVHGSTMEPLYVEPGNCLIDAKFPNFPPLLGSPSQWTQGLVGGFNTALLQKVLSIPGYAQFYHKAGEENPDRHSVLFITQPPAGARGMGLIMPVRMATTVENAFPAALSDLDSAHFNQPKSAQA